MNVEIINVGTELLMGEILNSNAVILEKMCKELGMNVYYQSVVGDNPERLLQVLEQAFNRGANLVITTGGLGPTTDDLTKELSAKYLGLDLVYNQEEANLITDKIRFLNNSLEVTKNNLKQAYFPLDSIILENKVGTASGCVMSKDSKMIINLPGPPKELSFMIEDVVKPYLKQYQQAIIYSYEFITSGIGESKLDELLSDIINKQEDVSIALYAQEDFVRIRLACKAISQEEADSLMANTKNLIYGVVKPYLILEANLFEALKKIMVPCTIKYHDDFRLSNLFDGLIKGNDLIIDIKYNHLQLGDEVVFDFKYLNSKYQFVIRVLGPAYLSLKKIETNLIKHLYWFLKEEIK